MHTNATIWGISCSLSLKVKCVISAPLVPSNRIAKIKTFQMSIKRSSPASKIAQALASRLKFDNIWAVSENLIA